ncbi:serpin-ZX-like [Lotus japonicus]|uniref:serpin-ZX-like n=1 Tax=Lotus japonicus TaxID=34305 RepID=UPI00258F78CA|nr:serpin-ZX-like [Lotus japonicus]XP_057423107.1 serpin-ZX-like [Lotus japonicus]XP_057423108.1 serpin-ZX-like [Lotus japonicus]XP_057423109.1 serpin-ZX-like [Lotus japonicus]XP_057423110.1 serpin-ZX-like [Lotus japonicus]
MAMDLQKSKSNSIDAVLSFTKHVLSKEEYQEKNLVFSPLSLYAALSVMAAGADGLTLDELLSFLRFDSVDHLTTFFSQVLSPVLFSDDHLSFANGMWVDQSLSIFHSFKQLVSTHYKATLASLDFKTQGNGVLPEVNSWVEKETNGHITHLLPPEAVNNLTRLIFANALRFKGTWKHKFDGKTMRLAFYLLNDTSVQVPFMTSKKKTQYIRAFDGFKILRLPYKQGRDRKRRFSMCFFLPDATDGLPALIQKLSSESAFFKGKLPRRKVRVGDFKIPKFTIPFTFEASNMLEEVGVVSPFSPCHADFTKMVEVNSTLDKLHVQNIFQKVTIQVSEVGSEATVATTFIGRKATGGSLSSCPAINFVADHPFLFLIREDFTGTILFIGQVLHPHGRGTGWPRAQ